MNVRPGAEQVPYAIDGKTHMVTPPRPKLPRSLDRTLLGAIVIACTLLLVAVIVWATVNIGELLSGMVPGWAAYGGASAFNSAWIICLGLEWVDRHAPQQAHAAMVAGWVFLALEMAAVIVHGHREHALAVGIVGALASAIVKTVWFLLLRRYATPLDWATQQWVEHERARLGAERGLLHFQTDALHAQAQLAQRRAALGFVDPGYRPAPQLEAPPATEPAAPAVAPAATPVYAGQPVGAAPAAARVDDPVQLGRIIDAALAEDGLTKADMVRAVIKVAPNLSAGEVSAAIEARRGVKVPPGYVRTIRTGRTKPPAGQPEAPATPQAPGLGNTAGPYL